MSGTTKLRPGIGSAHRRVIRSSGEFVTIAPLFETSPIPTVIESSIESLKLHTWIGDNLPKVADLLRGGAILFRGFDVADQADFRMFTRSIDLEYVDYMERATPRTALGDSIYTSTEFPPEHAIALHNENSYVMTWPMKICFCCLVAPPDGGETPIADVRRVLKRISPDVRQHFEEEGYMLVRNFSEYLGLPWRVSFRLSTKEELESYCRRARIAVEWRGPERLRTRQVRPAVATHPQTQEQIWFNHIAFWHSSSLEKTVAEMFLSEYTEEDLPYNTYYGDGTPIEVSVIEHIRAAYDAETILFRWRKGDVLLLDNMLVAHGRRPFKGPRKIIVSMGEPYTRTDLVG